MDLSTPFILPTHHLPAPGEARHIHADGRPWCSIADVAWIEQNIERIPDLLRNQIRNEYRRRWRQVHDSAPQGWGEFEARRSPKTNAWLADLVRLVPVDVDITMGHGHLTDLARLLADNATVTAGRFPSMDADEIMAHLRGIVITTHQGGAVTDRRWLAVPNVPAPGGSTKQVRRNKVGDELWWRRAIARRVRRAREHLALAAGLVSARRARYCSDLGLLERKEQKERWERFADQHFLIDTRTGLKRALKSAIRSADAQASELLCITNGMDRMAAERDWTWVMVTLTLPGEWHAAPEKPGADHQWNGATPDLAFDKLLHLTTNARKEMDRQGIGYFALRVVEPHKDACPHIHVLLYCAGAHQTHVEAVFRRQFPGTKQAQFTWSDGRAKGSSYVLKYVKKNLGGSGQTGADRVDAWRATWRIRAFAFWGLPHMSAWRELRRLKSQPEDPMMRAAWRAARASDFHRFWHAMTPADGTSVRPLYIPTTTRHGEESRTLIGLRRWDPSIQQDIATQQTREPGRWVLDVDYRAGLEAAPGLDAIVMHSSPRGAADATPNVNSDSGLAGAFDDWEPDFRDSCEAQEGQTEPDWIPDPSDPEPTYVNLIYEPGAEG